MLPPGLSRPVGSIWCVGRNYAEHARELGNAVPEEPLIFLKPRSALLFDAGVLRLPPDSSRVDHELELVVSAGPEPRMAVGIDFTARDLQEKAKAKGQPWTLAKARPGFAAVGPFRPLDLSLGYALKVNGAERQRGDARGMVWPVGKLLDFLRSRYPLADDDLVYTGTPPGVGPVADGDALEASFADGSARLRLRVER